MTDKFSGEMMNCIMCRKKEERESGWTYIALNGAESGYYVCPQCIHTGQDYAKVYERILRRIARLEKRRAEQFRRKS